MKQAKTLKLFESRSWVARLQGIDSSAVKNGFFANYLAALMLLKLKDLKGLMLVKDPQHAKLTRFTAQMSDVTFWGRALFYPHDPLVKSALLHGHADLLDKEAGRILDSRVQKVIKTVMTPPEQVNWPETIATLVLLKHRFEVQSSYLDKIGLALQQWDKLSSAQRKNAVGASFLYLLQSDPKSALLSRMRELSNGSMLRDISALAMKLVSVKKLEESRLSEDGEGTSTGSIAGTPTSVLGNAIISRGEIRQMRTAAAACNKPNASAEARDQLVAMLQKYNKLAPEQVGSLKGAAKLMKRIAKRERAFKLIKWKAPVSMGGGA